MNNNGTNGVRTIGRDSISAGIDECELVEIQRRIDTAFDDILPSPTAPAPKLYDNTGDRLERLNDLTFIVARAKHLWHLASITANYGLDQRQCDYNVDKIVHQTLKTVHHVSAERCT